MLTPHATPTAHATPPTRHAPEYDYIQERLFSIAFRPNGPNGIEASFVEYNALTGNLTQIVDISRDLRGGFVFGGAVSLCPTDQSIFVGVDARDGVSFWLRWRAAWLPAPRSVSRPPPSLPPPPSLISGLQRLCD